VDRVSEGRCPVVHPRRLLLIAVLIAGGLLIGPSAPSALAAYELAVSSQPDRSGAQSMVPPDQVHLAWTGDPSTTLTMVWRTRSTSTPSTVRYRLAGTTTWQQATGAPRSSGTAGTLHEAQLTGLTPGSAYEYRVSGDGGAWSETFTARTAPAPGHVSFDAIYYADTGLIGRTDGLATGTRQAIDEIARLRPLLVLPGGDYAYFDTDKRFTTLERTIDEWFNQQQPVLSRSVAMPTYGNHEVLLGESFDAWARRFPTPAGFDGRRNYSFDVGDVHFVSILAVQETTGLTSATLGWIEQDIAAAKARGQRWIVPYMHVPSFSDGSSHPSNVALRGQLGPLFERLGVKLVLTSHDQNYERTFPLVGVPSAMRATSTSLTCYTLADGVTWAKVSPAGKLSNKNGDFSKFRTFPPPFWTAFRDDTMHHFARLRVTPDALHLEAYGFSGNGAPPAVIDSFEYRVDVCGGQPPPPRPPIPPEPLPPPPPRPVDTCNDGIDSDGDGKVDLGDLEYGNATGVPSRSCDKVHTSCLDLIDNDGDGKRDGLDADVNGGGGILAATRCDQVKPSAVDGHRTLPVRLICNKLVGRRGRNVAYHTRAPRRCEVWRTGWADSQGLTFSSARWTGWGTGTARARVTMTAHGFRARARIKAYRLRRDCTGDYRVYTRVALLPSGKRRRAVVLKPDTCPG
jgi:acid phosphatase type 7